MRLWLHILFAGALSLVSPNLRASPAEHVGFIDIHGAIGPATANYIARAIQAATVQNDACLVIQLTTPGGLLLSTEDIVQSFYASPIPIVVYVAPAGANATSAGCFITLAADIAAMAPNTSIGAAHPVSLGTGGEEKTDDVMKQKLEQYGSSYIEAIAEKRGRNVEWARSTVLQSISITAEKALRTNAIDLIARDMPDLLKQLDGRVLHGKKLQSAGAVVIPIPMAASEKLFQMLWRPEVMLFLMLIAMYGIIGEISHPGAVAPGVAGAIALVLVLYMSSILPVNYTGLALVGLAMILFIIDIYAPTHGVLTCGGVLSFFLGAMMLFGQAGPAYHLSLAYILPATLLTAAFFLFAMGAGVRAQLLPVRTGRENMLGQSVAVLTRTDASGGKVFVEGEQWNAVSATPIEPGQPAEIVRLEGLTLVLKPKTK